MTVDEAATLIADARISGGAETWADLGSGDGIFTMALATILPRGSTIHAMDRDAPALRRIPRAHAGSSIVPHAGDFTTLPWPFTALDGVLFANSLHFVPNPGRLVGACEQHMKSPARFLIVEYDTDEPNSWVPYPISYASVERVLGDAGYSSIRRLGTRRSIYQRARIYAALIEGPPKR